MTTSRLLLAILLLFKASAMAFALEEPEFEVIEQYAEFEIRHYPPYIVAEVDVAGDFDESGDDAFRILAGYIFGDNAASEKMAMTAPVESRPKDRSVTMAMTAPVTTSLAGENVRTFAFVMESKYTLQTLPVPNDERVRIRQVPERTMAVRRYSGRWTEAKYLKNEERLLAALEANGFRTIGRPSFARYNSPFSLPFLRRNEVMIEIVPDPVQDGPE